MNISCLVLHEDGVCGQVKNCDCGAESPTPKDSWILIDTPSYLQVALDGRPTQELIDQLVKNDVRKILFFKDKDGDIKHLSELTNLQDKDE